VGSKYSQCRQSVLLPGELTAPSIASVDSADSADSVVEGEWAPSIASADRQCCRSIHCLTCSDLLPSLCALGSHPIYYPIYPLDPIHHDISVGSHPPVPTGG
jgi:hypothetical protein